MFLRPPRSTLTDTLVPDTTLFRSARRRARLRPSPSARQRQERGGTRSAGGRIYRSGCCGRVWNAPSGGRGGRWDHDRRSEEHTSELQSLMRISYAVFCLKKKKTPHPTTAEKQLTTQTTIS